MRVFEEVKVSGVIWGGLMWRVLGCGREESVFIKIEDIRVVMVFIQESAGVESKQSEEAKE